MRSNTLLCYNTLESIRITNRLGKEKKKLPKSPYKRAQDGSNLAEKNLKVAGHKKNEIIKQTDITNRKNFGVK